MNFPFKNLFSCILQSVLDTILLLLSFVFNFYFSFILCYNAFGRVDIVIKSFLPF